MKKTVIALCMASTVLLSGVAGYGGTMLARATLLPAGWSDYQPLSAVLEGREADSGDITGGINSDITGGVGVNESDTRAVAQADVTLAQLTTSNRVAMEIPEIAQAVAHSVVEIATEQVASGGWIGQYVLSGAGSGVIVSSDGYIVTNNHVIEGASKITVRLKNGESYQATLVGRDPKSDLAVIKIAAADLLAVSFGNSANLVVGELAVAIGNPLGELGGTVTEGIISALNRDILMDGEKMNLLQTSAAVNPGNSGGALFNAYGELIGVINAKSSGSNIEGIGFAIPSNTVKATVEQLIRYGYVQGRIDFGVSLVDISDMFTAMRYGVSSLGVYVSKSDEDSGLQAGDRIISINGQEVKTAAEVKVIYDQYNVGDALELVVARGGKAYKATVTLKQAKY